MGQVLVARQQDKNRKGVCILGVMGKQDGEAGTGVEELADITRPDWS